MWRPTPFHSLLSTGFQLTGNRDGRYPSYEQPSTISANNPMLIRVQVNNTRTFAILDTGSISTIIHYSFLQQIKHYGFTPIRRSYSSANCSPITIIGETLLQIKVNNICTYIKAVIASQLVTNILLGTDWISRYVISIHLPLKQIIIRDKQGYSTKTSILTLHRSTVRVSLTNHITIAPYSELIVDVHIDQSTPADLLFEPSSMFTRKAIYIPRSIIHVNRNHSKLLILNTSDHPFTLSKNTCLGTTRSCNVVCHTRSHSLLDGHSIQSLHQCYVCHRTFSLDTELQHHLRDQCYPSELCAQITTLTQHLTAPQEQSAVQRILWNYGKLFDTRKASKINITLENAINTGNHRPIHTTPYRRSPKDHQAIDEQTAALLRDGRVEPSTSPWSSPVVLVRKKDGTTRFCVDYRKLNEFTDKDSFPLPRIDDIFDQISGSHFFTKLDFKSGYFQVPLAVSDRPKTAFSTRNNHFQFTVLPQGVKNGPPTFQRIVNDVLRATHWHYCLAYIDDILIFSKTFSDHLNHLNEVLRLLHNVNFRLNINKCIVAADCIDFLGHTVQNGVIRPNTDNIPGLLQTPTPTCPREVFRFVKSAEYYRKFIRNFSTIASPLYPYGATHTQSSTHSKSTKFVLSEAAETAFRKLKDLLTSDLVLRLPNMELPFKIQTDASADGIGAVLLQNYPDGDRPVCYLSKKFTPTQQRWATIEQECFAIVMAIKQWHHYLHGSRFLIETDHKALEALMKQPQANSKCERWRLLLQSYDFSVKHIPGVSNSMSDYLSRSPVDPGEDDSDEDDDSSSSVQIEQPTFVVNMVTTRSRTHQAQPDTLSNCLSSTSTSQDLPQASSTSQTTGFTGDLDTLRTLQHSDSPLTYIIEHISDRRFANTYFIEDDILMYRRSSTNSVPCVPSGTIRRDIIQLYHDSAANGAHFGRDKTLRKIRDRYYWDSMSSDVTNFIRSCLRCAENNPIRRKPPGHLQSIPPPDGVWQLLTMDFHGPISPTSQRGNRYIVSLTDVLSKFVITRAVRDCTAATAARFLQEDVICQYGTPKYILTDNGTHFTSTMMEQLLKRIGVTHIYATPYHPQTNGQIERFNSTMDAKIAALSNASRSDWDAQLPYVTFNYNTSVHSTTKLIPFELIYGCFAVLPCDPQNSIVSLHMDPSRVRTLQQRLSTLTDIAKQNILDNQRLSQGRFNAHRSNPTYNIHDIVLIRNLQRRHKLDVRYEGPYRIVKYMSPKTYLVQHIRLHNLTRQVTVDSILPITDRTQ